MRAILVGLLFSALATLALANNACNLGTACRPFGNGTTCATGDWMDLRFRLQVTGENRYVDSVTLNTNNYVTFGVCAKVDELQAFELEKATSWGVGQGYASTGNVTSINSALSNFTTLDVFGMGPLPYRDYPLAGDDAAAIFYENVTGCGSNGFPGPAVVNFLVLNITMTKGAYSYTPADSPLPIQNGFVPTCKDGTCLIDGGTVCVGKGKQNCATCVNSVNGLLNTKVHIWAAYYGTDNNGRRFTSGSNNPIDFQQFSTDSVLNTIKGSF